MAKARDMQALRMTTWRWMVAVAVVALATSGFVGVRAVWQYFLAMDRARYHTGMEDTLRWLDQSGRDQLEASALADDVIKPWLRAMGDAELLERLRVTHHALRLQVALNHRQMEYHVAMARKYRYVARFPWLPVEPDLPEP
jgi:hypothetical protein